MEFPPQQWSRNPRSYRDVNELAPDSNPRERECLRRCLSFIKSEGLPAVYFARDLLELLGDLTDKHKLLLQNWVEKQCNKPEDKVINLLPCLPVITPPQPLLSLPWLKAPESYQDVNELAPNSNPREKECLRWCLAFIKSEGWPGVYFARDFLKLLGDLTDEHELLLQNWVEKQCNMSEDEIICQNCAIQRTHHNLDLCPSPEWIFKPPTCRWIGLLAHPTCHEDHAGFVGYDLRRHRCM